MKQFSLKIMEQLSIYKIVWVELHHFHDIFDSLGKAKLNGSKMMLPNLAGCFLDRSYNALCHKKKKAMSLEFSPETNVTFAGKSHSGVHPLSRVPDQNALYHPHTMILGFLLLYNICWLGFCVDLLVLLESRSRTPAFADVLCLNQTLICKLIDEYWLNFYT